MRFISKIFLVFIGLISSLLIAELYFRIFNPQQTIDNYLVAYDFPCYEKGDYYWIRLKANANCKLKSNAEAFHPVEVKTNSLHMRNDEIIIPKPQDTIRILFVGDSFTFGHGVDEDEAYPRVVESLLTQKYPDKKIEVINAGLPGAGVGYYYLFLKNQGIALEPDIIVVGFYMLNDIPENALFSKWEGIDEKGLPLKTVSSLDFIDSSGKLLPRSVPLKFKIPYLRNLNLFAFLMDRFHHEHDWEKTNVVVTNPVINPETCLYKEECHDLDDAKDRVKKLFIGIKNLAEKNNSKLMVVSIPAEFQSKNGDRLKYGIAIPLLPNEKDYPYLEFGKFFQESNISFLDPRSFLREAQDNIFFKLDNHWNPLGHYLAAQIITQRISEEFFKE